MTALPNPLLPGFNPDPSIVLADGMYYLVTSTFEYLPGLPVYRSTDLITWEQIGNVATREAQIGVADAPTGLGVWAPTIRHHDGLFYVIVTIAAGERGCVVFTAEDPAGEWSDGLSIEGVGGIDPDLAWDGQGNAYVTYSGLILTGEDIGRHLGVQQVRVDLIAGRALEEPRSLWSGTGLQFPEAPHVFPRNGSWYLMIAEGGTERGHGVSIARGPSIEGPFEGAPANPVLSARSTTRPIQNTGHADLVAAPDGSDVLVLLGMRPLGSTRAFSPLGRETFVTPVRWVEGWPQPDPVTPNPRPGVEEEHWDFSDSAVLDDVGWLAVRRTPAEVGSLSETSGRLTLHGVDGGMAAKQPAFLGRRQRHLTTTTSTVLDASRGAGGLAFRYDEQFFVAIEARGDDAGTTVTAMASVPAIQQTWSEALPAGEVQLRIETDRPPTGFSSEAMGGDRVRLVAAAGGVEVLLTELDGRFWTAETAASFTGRVAGVFASAGTVTFSVLDYRGEERS
jgi:beta-xylosidase